MNWFADAFRVYWLKSKRSSGHCITMKKKSDNCESKNTQFREKVGNKKLVKNVQGMNRIKTNRGKIWLKLINVSNLEKNERISM